MSHSPSLAVIDLGTNTFHLLIVRENPSGGWTELCRERRFVKLAENGIRTIGQSPFRRGQEALLSFRKKMDEYGVARYRAIGTAAMRTATNGAAFVTTALKEAKIQIEIIDGDEEARLIGRGVSAALPALKGDERLLIMDIGGGSVEFISQRPDKADLPWAASFPVGVAVLRDQFHRQEPMGAGERTTLVTHLTKVLRPLLAELERRPAHHLVGAAGIFDVAAAILGGAESESNATGLRRTIDLEKLEQFYERCKNTTLAERTAMPEIPEARADMMVVTLELIRFVIEQAGIDRLTVSGFSLKEGVLLEMLEAQH